MSTMDNCNSSSIAEINNVTPEHMRTLSKLKRHVEYNISSIPTTSSPVAATRERVSKYDKRSKKNERKRIGKPGTNPIRTLITENQRIWGINEEYEVQYHHRELLLQVVDFDFDKKTEPMVLLVCSNPINLASRIRALPLQAPRTVRNFICNFHIRDGKPPGSDVVSYLQELGVNNIGFPQARTDPNNLMRLAPQWQQKKRALCLGFLIYNLVDDSDHLRAYMQCLTLEDDKLIGLYSMPTHTYSYWRWDWSTDLLDSFFKRDSVLDLCLQAQHRDWQAMAKLIVLNFLNRALFISTNRVADYKFLEDDDYKFSGYQGLDYHAVDIHNKQNTQVECLIDTVQDLIDAIDYVIAAIQRSASQENTTKESLINVTSSEQEDFIELTRCRCAHLKKLSTRIQAYNDRRYNLYVSARSIHESESVSNLTTLATGFLPLSLAAGLLSMQTRFSNLGILLYDFVGVGSLMFAFMFLLYFSLRWFARPRKWNPFGRPEINIEHVHAPAAEEARLRNRKRTTKLPRMFKNIIFKIVFICVVTSFVIGMFKRASLGLEMLGYGAACAIGVVIVCAVAVFLFAFYLDMMRLRKYNLIRNTPRDEESDPVETVSQCDTNSELD